MKRNIPIGGTIFMLAGVAALCWLGHWQTERLQWKNALIQKIEAEYSRDPLDNAFDADAIKAIEQETPPIAYGSLRGQFHHEFEILIGPRTHDGKPGYHIVTPFSVAGGGGRVLVNRGWVPLDLADPVKRLENQGEEMVTLTGMARLPDKPNPFTPHNDPKNHTWYSVNAEDIGIAANMPGLPSVVFYAETQAPPISGDYPVMQAERKIPNNNHLQYAIFWYTMAALFVLIYLLRFFGPQKNKQ